MADPPNSLLGWVSYVPAEVREEICSHFTTQDCLAFVVDYTPTASDSPSYAYQIDRVRQSFWATFLVEMRRDSVWSYSLGPLLESQGIEIQKNDLVEHVSILDGLINQARNATMIIVDRKNPHPFSSNIASGVITIQSYESLAIFRSPFRLGISRQLFTTQGAHVFKHFNVFKNVKHLEFSNMTISGGHMSKRQLVRSIWNSSANTGRYGLQFPDRLLHEATAIKKVTFSNVEFSDSHFAIPQIVVDKVCIKNCTGTSAYIFSTIAAKSLEIHGDGVYITWPFQQISDFMSHPEKIDYTQLVDLKLHMSTQLPTFLDPQGFNLANLKALKRASISVHYKSCINLPGRLPRSLEVLEVRDCDPTITMIGARESWIQDILYNESAPNLPNLRNIHVQFSTKPSQEAVRFHKFLQMQFVLKKDIVFRFSYR